MLKGEALFRGGKKQVCVCVCVWSDTTTVYLTPIFKTLLPPLTLNTLCRIWQSH